MIVGALTDRVYAWLPMLLRLSVAVMVKLNVPPAVGVPESKPAFAPLGVRVSPAGKDPEVTA